MNQIFKRSALVLAILVGVNVILLPSISSAAATKVDLGASSSFGVLAATAVSNAATATTITGTAGSMVGVTAGTSVTGTATLTSGTIVTGTTAPAPAAMVSAQAAYTAGRNQTPFIATLPADLGGLTLTADHYKMSLATETLTGNLTLDGGNNPAAVFIFDTSAALTTASASTVTLTNGAQACNVFWLIGSQATLGSGSTFVGHVIAGTAVVATSGTHVAGSLTALTANVSLDNTTIVNDNCAAVAVVPAPAQSSRVDSVTPAACVATGPTKVILNGLFPTAISNITVNGIIIPNTDWVQTSTSIVVTSPVQTNAAVIIQLYNGAVPLLAVQSFVCVPTGAVTPIIPVVIPSVPTITTGTIHVIKVVNNTYGGTAVAGDFMLSLRHHGVDVAGSPAAAMGGAGRTYVLAPGTYVVGEPDSPGYIHAFDINGQATQNIVLAAGESITVTQTNNQLPQLSPVETPTTPPTPVTPPVHTVKGGKLPKTSSPWFNLLLFGLGGLILGGSILGRKISTQN